MSNKTIALAAALEAFIVGNAVAASLSLDGEWKLSYRNQLMLMRPDKKLYQVIADPTGRWHFYLARHSSDEHGGIIVRTEVEPDKGWRIFFAVPVDALRFNMQVTPVVIDADMFRVRLDPSEESGWTPVDGFFETSRYGQLVFDFE